MLRRNDERFSKTGVQKTLLRIIDNLIIFYVTGAPQKILYPL